MRGKLTKNHKTGDKLNTFEHIFIEAVCLLFYEGGFELEAGSKSQTIKKFLTPWHYIYNENCCI